MAFTLNGTAIKAPQTISETVDNIQYAQQRTLSGSVNRDYFGNNKRVWKLSYTNIQKTYYDVIKSIYDTYTASGTAVTWVSTETNYAISSTNVHVNIDTRGFSVGGEDYISSFTLILTEA
jgi:hypothetical protein